VLPNYGKPYADAVARLYVDVARQEKIDRVPCFVCGVGIKKGMMQADGIHPNEKAQARMLDNVWPHIRAKLRCPVNTP
jgi:acyl-CoA thioesterase-1